MDIEMIHITKQFDGKQILKDCNITFAEGKVNCLMGASGTGKTTLINILMGLIKPDSGEIRGVQGKRFAAVFQEDRLIEHWDAIKNIRLVCDKEITDEKIIQELEEVAISERTAKPVSSFSGGMKRRVAIVRAVMAKSDILIFDEPFKGLDMELRMKAIEYINHRSKGKTVIVITHDKEEANSLGAEHFISLINP